MPVTQITLLSGYAPEVQERLLQRVGAAVRSVIDAPEAGTTSFVQEVSSYRRNGQAFQHGNAALPVASERVSTFLQAMEARDIPTARGLLAPSFTMVFPGGVQFTALEQLVDWARGRYQHVGKHFEGIEESWQSDRTVVLVRGTLHGVWPDGQPFEGVRFIDRFEVVAGLLQRQEVWNDLAIAVAARVPR